MKVLPSNPNIRNIHEFERHMLSQDEDIWSSLNFIPSINDNDSTTIAADIYSQLLGEGGRQHSFLLERYLQMIAMKDSSFTFSFWKDQEGRFAGCVFMTGMMRRNLELYGSYISLDMCKRDLNDESWPYVAVTTMNEFNKVVVCMEGVLMEESEDAYNFLCKNLIEMCPGRTLNQYSCVAGDGFFNQDMIERLFCPDTKFVHDNWHLRESWKSNFGMLFGVVKPYLDTMLYSTDIWIPLIRRLQI